MRRKILAFTIAISALALAPIHAQPDLVASVTSVTPDPAAPGTSISIGWKVTNQGSGLAVVSGLKVYLSNDANLDATDTYLTPSVSVISLGAGTSVAGTVSRSLPVSTTLGLRYILAEADAFQAVAESQEGNNQSFHSFTVSSCGAPGAFNLSSPINGSFQPSGTVSLSLSWGNSSGATSYDVYFGTGSNPQFLVNQTATSRTVSVSVGNTYSWKVIAKNGCGQTAAPISGTWSFSVFSCTTPGSFSLSSPANGASFASTTTSVSLSWGASSGATSYEVYFGTSSNPPFLASQTGTTRNVSVSAGQTYYWKVIAKTGCASTSNSGIRSFSVDPASGGLTVTVQDQNGTPRPGAKVVRYPHGSGTAIDMVTTNAAGQTPAYTNIAPGTVYDLEAYYEGANPFDALGELWTTATLTVTSGANSLILRRDWPYVDSLRVFRVIDNLELTGSTQIAPGDEVRVEAMVRNQTSVNRNVSLRFLLDRDQIPTWDHDSMAPSAVVPSQTAQIISAKFTPTQLGTFAKAIRTEVSPGGKTDAWNWVLGFIVHTPTVSSELFDDFLYNGRMDCSSKGIWSPVNGPSSPPIGATYLQDNVDFSGGILRLTSTTGNSLGSMLLSRLETKRKKFLRGTYAARILFSDDALDWVNGGSDRGDGNVQAFYTINDYGNDDDRYSECDFEYLPWDAFGTTTDRATKIYSVTWERRGGYTLDYRLPKPTLGSLEGDWHTLMFQVDTDKVHYYLDGHWVATHDQPYVPESPMMIALGNWIVNSKNLSPADDETFRSYVMQVDWLYHAQDQFLSPEDLRARVRYLQIRGGEPEDTIPEVVATPYSLSFSDVSVGTSEDRTITVQNVGEGMLTGAATTDPPFQIIGLASYSLAHGESQILTIRFTPTSAQSYNGRLNLSGGAGTTVEITGTGTGTDSIPSPDPSWLRVTTVSQTQLDLQWDDNSSNEDGFKIERKEGCCGPWTEIAAMPANMTIYQSTGLTCSTTYAYRVWAYNAAGNSGKTNEAASTISACSAGTVPTPAPSWLRVSAVSTQIDLQWDDNSSNENGFKVERKEGCCGPWTEIVTLPTNSTIYQNTGLTCGTAYAYRVWAFNTAGGSEETNEAGTTTPDC